MDVLAELKLLLDDMYGRYHELPADRRTEWLQKINGLIDHYAQTEAPSEEKTDG